MRTLMKLGELKTGTTFRFEPPILDGYFVKCCGNNIGCDICCINSGAIFTKPPEETIAVIDVRFYELLDTNLLPIEAEIKGYQKGDVIKSIKDYRARTGLSLSECKKRLDVYLK